MPPERGNVPRPRGRVTRHKTKDTSGSRSPDVKDVAGSGEHVADSPSPEAKDVAGSREHVAGSPSPDPAEGSEDPTPILVHNYIRPLLTQDTTITEVRRKVGHEKGRSWTPLLNRLIDRINELQSQCHRETAST